MKNIKNKFVRTNIILYYTMVEYFMQLGQFDQIYEINLLKVSTNIIFLWFILFYWKQRVLQLTIENIRGYKRKYSWLQDRIFVDEKNKLAKHELRLIMQGFITRYKSLIY